MAHGDRGGVTPRKRQPAPVPIMSDNSAPMQPKAPKPVRAPRVRKPRPARVTDVPPVTPISDVGMQVRQPKRAAQHQRPETPQEYAAREISNPHPDPGEDLRVLGFVGASELARSRARLKAQRAAAEYAARQHEAAHGLLGFAERHTGHLIPYLHDTAHAAEVTGDALGHAAGVVAPLFELPGVGNAGAGRYAGQAQQRERAEKATLGKSATNLLLHGNTSDPLGAALELGSMVTGPFKILGAVAEAGRAARAGEGLAEIGRAAKLGHEAPIARAISRMKVRTFDVGGHTVQIPAARARSGRLVERLADRIRNRTPGLKTTEAKAGRELGYSVEHVTAGTKNQYADALRYYGKRLTAPQEYALRIVAEGATPEARVSFHHGQAAVAHRADQVYYHALHADMAQKASKYIKVVDGVPQLADDAPAKLHKAWELFQQAGQMREQMVKDLGLLSDTAIANRVHAPARVIHGARFQTFEAQVEDAFSRSPSRAALFHAIDQTASSPMAAQHDKTLWDAAIRAAVQREKVPPAEMASRIEQTYAQLAGVQTGVTTEHLPPPMTSLFQVAARAEDPNTQQYYLDLAHSLKGHAGIPFTAKSPKRLTALFSTLRSRAIEAEAFRKWYTDSAHAILEHVGGNQEEATKLAQLLAIYSPRAKVWDNTTWNNVTRAIGAYDEFNQTGRVSPTWSLSKEGAAYRQRAELAAQKGESIKPHRDWQTEEANKVMQGAGDWTGLKTNNFYRNFLEDINPAKFAKDFGGQQGVTVDTWIRRAFGYPRTGAKGNETITEEMYHFMSEAITGIAHELGWSPKEAQAAIWTSIKSEMEGTPLDKAGVSFKEALAEMRSRGSQQTFFQGANPGDSFRVAVHQASLDLGPEQRQALLTAFAHFHQSGDEAVLSATTDAIINLLHEQGAHVSPALLRLQNELGAPASQRADDLLARLQSGEAIPDGEVQDVFKALDEEIRQAAEAKGLSFGNLRDQFDDPELWALHQKQLEIETMFRDQLPQLQKPTYGGTQSPAAIDHLYAENKGSDLLGLPPTVKYAGSEIAPHSYKPAQDLARQYMDFVGLPYHPPRIYVEVDPAVSKKIADAYEAMPHDPHNPEVAASYQAFISETLIQYHQLTAAGYTFEFYPEGADPYPNGPRDAMADVMANKHMYVYPTEAGFGSGGPEFPDHPLLQVAGDVTWNGKQVTYNDIFRGVHDFFGHLKEGVGFRADGEENAWLQHKAMYTRRAARAMTSETRGQNSWVNYGPHGEANRTASQAGTVYAEQKAGLLPEWVSDDTHPRGYSFETGGHTVKPPPGERVDINGASYPADHPFAQEAARQLEEHGAFARDLARSDVPITKWPRWAQNQIRRQAEERGMSMGDYISHLRESPQGGDQLDFAAEAQRGIKEVPTTPHPYGLEQAGGPVVHLADSQSPRGGYITKPATYLRFGDLPSGPSMDHLAGRPEEGVSVYSSWHDEQTGKFVLPSGSEQYVGTFNEIQSRPAFRVTGREIGTGSDGEPLLDPASVRVVGQVTPNEIVTEADPNLTLSGRELAPHETPDWHPGALGQRGGGLETVSPYGIKGAITIDPQHQQAILHLTEASDDTTLAHELGHFMRAFLTEDVKWKPVAKYLGVKNGKWTRDSEEKFARSLERVIRTGDGPAPVKKAFAGLAPTFREVYDNADLPDVPPHVARFIKRLFEYDKKPGGSLVGAEDILVGQEYAPLVRGVPVRMTRPGKAFAAYMRRAGSGTAKLFSGGRGGRAIGAGPLDAALSHEYQGSLLQSGFFTFDATEPKVESAMLATKMSLANIARKALVEAGHEIPQTPFDFAVKIDPSKDASDTLKAAWQKINSLQAGEGDKTVLEGTTVELLNEAIQSIVPPEIEGRTYSDVAREIMQTQEPVDNIVWVNPDFLEHSGLLQVPGAAKAQTETMRKIGGRLMFGYDALTDAQKALILWLNPAYVPMQLIGNLGMNLLHQGVFMPVNLWKSVLMHRDLEPMYRVFIDSKMGTGAAVALPAMTTGAKAFQATLGHWANLAADLIPRRSAFLHEARKLGLTSKDLPEIIDKALQDDPQATQIIDYITRRAKRSIVDFDRLNRVEREVLTRFIFFYPWLRGATDYTIHFIADHPVQAMGMALAYEHLKEAQKQQLGDQPYFTQLDVPINTRSLGFKVPGTGIDVGLDQAVGQHGLNYEGAPEVFSMRQLLTQTTPLELLQSGIAFAGGHNYEAAADVAQHLTPIPYAAGVSMFGYDPFSRQEVQPGLASFFSQLSPVQGPFWQKYTALNMTPEERAKHNKRALHPRSEGMDWTNLFLGSLGPSGYNKTRAAELYLKHAPTYARRVANLKVEAHDMGQPAPSQRVLDELETMTKLDHEISQLGKDATYMDKAKVVATLFDQKFPGRNISARVARVRTEGEAQRIYNHLRPRLYPAYSKYQARLDRLKARKTAREPVTQG